MNIAINNATQERDIPQMVDNPESHCLRFLHYALKRHAKKAESKLAEFDRDEIRRLTRGCHRDEWQPPCRGMLNESLAIAYMNEWGSIGCQELERFDISPNALGHIATRLNWQRHTTRGRGGQQAVHYTK